MSRASRQSSAGEPKSSTSHPTDSAAHGGADGLTFENALVELEKLVAQMEGGDLSLEQSLAAHKRGLELARFCQERLESAQQQVRVLEGDVLKTLGTVQPAHQPAELSSDDGDD